MASFSKEVLHEALEKVNERRKAADRAYEQKKAEVYKNNPELAAIDTEVQMKSSSMALCLFAGNTEEAGRLRKEVDLACEYRKGIFAAAKFSDEPSRCCKKCGDTGYVNGLLCDCVKSIAAEMCYSSLIGEMPIKESTFDNFDLGYYNAEKDENGISPRRQMTAVLKDCKSFADRFPCGENLLLTGGCGLGKTHLSLAVANEVISRGFSCIYGSAQNLISEINREAFDRSGSTMKIDSVTSCDLLILDDLGTEFSTQLSSSVVYEIINTRLLRKLSTIISTNLNIGEICNVYTERIASRIIGSYTVCPVFGSDIRRIKAQEK